MKVEKEMKYETPEVETLEVEVELGFSASSPKTDGSMGDIEIPDNF